jgi:hypothetical protein
MDFDMDLPLFNDSYGNSSSILINITDSITSFSFTNTNRIELISLFMDALKGTELFYDAKIVNNGQCFQYKLSRGYGFAQWATGMLSLLPQLEKRGFTFYAMDLQPENWIFLGGYWFFIGFHYLIELDKKDPFYLTISSPSFINKPYALFSPELQNIKILPIRVRRETCYHSFAQCMIYFIPGKKLESISCTQLYWLLSKNLSISPVSRSLLLF